MQRAKLKRPRTFDEFCEQFTDKKIPHVKIGRRYFYDPLGHYEKYKNLDLFSVGIYLGEEKGEFFATTALVDLLSEDKKGAVVNNKAAWLYICGRDVLMSGVIKPTTDDITIVRDEEGNVLGFGKTMIKHDPRLRNALYIKNILDRGEYLHRER